MVKKITDANDILCKKCKKFKFMCTCKRKIRIKK